MKMTDDSELEKREVWQLRHKLRLNEINEMRRAERTPLVYELARQTVQLQGLRSEREWRRWIRSNRKSLRSAFVGHYMPEHPDTEYDEFVSWDDWLGVPLDYAEAQRVAATLGVKSQVALVTARNGDSSLTRCGLARTLARRRNGGRSRSSRRCSS